MSNVLVSWRDTINNKTNLMDIIKRYYNKKEGYKASNLRSKKISELLGGDIKGKKFLDIGCGDGAFGNSLRQRGAIVHGCDISEGAIRKAKEVLDRAFVFDVEKDDFSQIGYDYDFIIASELIEHLFLPFDFLNNIKPLLSSNGKIIITTPNFLMWTLRIRMLFGQFEYSKTGFWDEGHIHFFTYKSLKKMTAKAGLKIERENHIIHPKIPGWAGRLWPSLFAYQIIFRFKSI